MQFGGTELGGAGEERGSEQRWAEQPPCVTPFRLLWAG
jgi:hypothetical protein